jgi:hypothetical protein
MMPKVFILAEGQTEETFVQAVLSPALQPLWLVPVIVKTRRAAGGSAHRGGYVTYARLKAEVQRLLGDTSAAAVTTMLDLYALPRDFPGLGTEAGGARKAQKAEEAFAKDIAHERFHPYLQLHEFEALFFAQVEVTNTILAGNARQSQHLADVRYAFPSPEDIDDGTDTAPSKRILKIYPDYDKVLHGPQIVQKIGLQVAREACAHFGAWVTWLESLKMRQEP